MMMMMMSRRKIPELELKDDVPFIAISRVFTSYGSYPWAEGAAKSEVTKRAETSAVAVSRTSTFLLEAKSRLTSLLSWTQGEDDARFGEVAAGSKNRTDHISGF